MDFAPAPDDRDADRALATRAAAGDAAAAEAFDLRFRPEVRHVAVRLGVRDEPDDLVHVLITRMLVGSAEHPAKIASYRGEGSLRSWVRAVATRFVIDHLRAVGARAPIVPLAEGGIAHSGGIEDDIEARRFSDIVRMATEAAFAELTPRQRNLLRHATFHRLGIDELAIIYRVHRTTTARWLQRTREELHAAIATKLAKATRMPADEARSLLRGVAGDADVSLRSVLSTAFEADDTG